MPTSVRIFSGIEKIDFMTSYIITADDAVFLFRFMYFWDVCRQTADSGIDYGCFMDIILKPNLEIFSFE